MTCPACDDRWQERSGCARCDDGARCPHASAQPDDAVAPELHAHATERAEWQVCAALRGTRCQRPEHVARRLCAALAHRPDAGDRAVRYLIGEGLDEHAARRIVATYAHALREHAQILRYHARRSESPRHVEDRRRAEVCEGHAARVESALPVWMRSAA